MVKENKVILFMKGNKDFPQCGFSNTVTQVMISLLSDSLSEYFYFSVCSSVCTYLCIFFYCLILCLNICIFQCARQCVPICVSFSMSVPVCACLRVCVCVRWASVCCGLCIPVTQSFLIRDLPNTHTHTHTHCRSSSPARLISRL